jgi:hypothetical protein
MREHTLGNGGSTRVEAPILDPGVQCISVSRGILGNTGAHFEPVFLSDTAPKQMGKHLLKRAVNLFSAEPNRSNQTRGEIPGFHHNNG